MGFNLISLAVGDRTIETDLESPLCCFCLNEIKEGESCYWCRVNKNVYCTRKECKHSFCRGIASMQDEHEDVLGVLVKIKSNKVNKS